MKRVAAALSLTLVGGATQAQAPALFDVADGSIVRVDCDRGRGSAFSVGVGRYVTAAHVLAAGDCTVSGEPVTETKTYKDDLATFSGPVRPVAQISCSGFKEGETYMASGFPGGTSLFVTEAVIATGKAVGRMQVFVGSAYPGMSGGAVYDRHGRVVGVVNMRWPTRSLPLSESPMC